MPHQTFERDPKYLAWIRTFPCDVRSDCEGSIEAHHAGRAYGGMKAGDYSAMPLCHKHHMLCQYYQWKFKEQFKFYPDEEYARGKYFISYTGAHIGRVVERSRTPLLGSFKTKKRRGGLTKKTNQLY